MRKRGICRSLVKGLLLLCSIPLRMQPPSFPFRHVVNMDLSFVKGGGRGGGEGERESNKGVSSFRTEEEGAKGVIYRFPLGETIEVHHHHSRHSGKAEHLYTVHSNLYSVEEGRGEGGDGEKNGEGGDMFPPDAVYSVRNSRSLSLPCLSPNAVVFLDPRVKVASFIVLLFPSPHVSVFSLSPRSNRLPVGGGGGGGGGC